MKLQSPALMGLSLDFKMHDAAKSFVGTFFTQMVEQMFQEANESNDSDDEGFETEMYSSFLSEAVAEKIAGSGSSKHMVAQVENKMRRQSGLDEINIAHKTYETMGTLANKTEDRHVRATAA